MIVIADTMPIITLIKLKRLDLLHQLFDNVNIPNAVYEELTSNPNFVDEANIINQCHFLQYIVVSDKQSVKVLQQVIGLDIGESEVNELNQQQILLSQNPNFSICRIVDDSFLFLKCSML